MNKTYKIAALVAGLFSAYAQGALAAHVRGPIELMRGLQLRAPIFTKALSASNQWAGRTTLASGSASVVISTAIVNSDSLIALNIQAAIPAAYGWQGRTAIASGLSTGTASTSAIYSGDAVALTWESVNALTSGQALRVDSIVNGISFAIATSNSLATVASGAVAMWKVHGKEFAPVKVNTISSNNFFTVGWGDNVARPNDATIMWEIRKTS